MGAAISHSHSGSQGHPVSPLSPGDSRKGEDACEDGRKGRRHLKGCLWAWRAVDGGAGPTWTPGSGWIYGHRHRANPVHSTKHRSYLDLFSFSVSVFKWHFSLSFVNVLSAQCMYFTWTFPGTSFIIEEAQAERMLLLAQNCFCIHYSAAISWDIKFFLLTKLHDLLKSMYSFFQSICVKN